MLIADEAVASRPAWTTPLGNAPADPQQKADWARHIGIIAAYREQHRVLTDDPTHILGPYAEPGHPEHAAYWHAVNSIVAARRLGGLDEHHRLEPEHAQAAADVYLALPADERTAVHAAIIERRTDLWFGDRRSLDDRAVTHPHHARDLHEVLVQRGHLTAPQSDTAPRDHSPPTLDSELRDRREQPREAELAARHSDQRDTERAARLERARQSKIRALGRTGRTAPSATAP